MIATPDLIALIVGVVGGTLGIASSLGSFFGGKTDIQDKVIKAYEDRVSQLEGDVKGLQEQQKIMQADLDRKEALLVTLTNILQNRNPEFENFMATSLKLLNDIHTKLLFTS